MLDIARSNLAIDEGNSLHLNTSFVYGRADAGVERAVLKEQPDL
jgi:hypothetical protein